MSDFLSPEMLAALLEIRHAPGLSVPIESFPLGTCRALIKRGLARFDFTMKPAAIVATAYGCRHIDNLRRTKTPRHLGAA